MLALLLLHFNDSFAWFPQEHVSFITFVEEFHSLSPLADWGRPQRGNITNCFHRQKICDMSLAVCSAEADT